jgi:hypothetical protein
MDTNKHTLQTLFKQLGLASDEKAIASFIAEHKPLPDMVPLVQAEFWSLGQRAFLDESLKEDADWAEVVDQLDTLLRS